MKKTSDMFTLFIFNSATVLLSFPKIPTTNSQVVLIFLVLPFSLLHQKPAVLPFPIPTTNWHRFGPSSENEVIEDTQQVTVAISLGLHLFLIKGGAVSGLRACPRVELMERICMETWSLARKQRCPRLTSCVVWIIRSGWRRKGPRYCVLPSSLETFLVKLLNEQTFNIILKIELYKLLFLFSSSISQIVKNRCSV